MTSAVSATPAAPSDQALRHFSDVFSYETDCADVRQAMADGQQDFVLLDVRSPALYAEGHAPGAISMPHGKIVDIKLRDYPAATLFVVYCAGPHCNGAQRAAARLAHLQRPVKVMPGGMTGWVDEGFALATAND
jgi:rhodanese-related sulfurtransferase